VNATAAEAKANNEDSEKRNEEEREENRHPPHARRTCCPSQLFSRGFANALDHWLNERFHQSTARR